MKTLILALLSLPLLAGEWKFSRSITWGYANAPAMIKPLIAPGAPGGWVVVIDDMPDEARGADAYEITIRYARYGAIWTRTQIARPQVDGNRRAVVGDVFDIGQADVLSVAARAIRWESKKEVNQ